MGEGEGEGQKNDAGEAPPPVVVLGVELHCAGCAKKVRKSIRHMPGVQSVVADAAANRVVVNGTADAAALKARIESKTKKPVEILSASPGKPAPAEPKKNSDKGTGGDEKKNSDKDGGGDKGDKVPAGSSQPPPREEKEKKQPPEEGKPREAETVLLKIRLHCDACADRIRLRIYKIKGVKDVALDGNAKDEVKVTGTMDVAAMVSYLREKLNRAVDAVAAPGKKDAGVGGGDDKGLDEKKDKAAGGGEDVKKDKGKGVEEVVGPSTAAAAASMAPAPAAASTHHVSPYGHVSYPQPQVPPPGGYYGYYGGDNNANAGGYYGQHPGSDAGAGGSYYYQHPGADAAAGSYYYQQQHPAADHIPNPQPYPYHFDMAPAPQMFSDENPNACSLM